MSESRETGGQAFDASRYPSADSDLLQTPLEAAAGGDEISLLDLLVALAKHKFLVIGLPLVAAVVAVVVSLLLPNVYTATAKILPPQPNQSTGAVALLAQMGGSVASALTASKSDIYVSMLKSRTVADNLIQRFRLMQLYDASSPSQARARLAGAVTINAGKDGIITIEVNDTDPKRASEFANAYVDELAKLTQVLAVTEASQRRLFFERQFAQAKNSLAKAEAAARQALGAGVVNVDVQGRAMLETTARLRGQITVKEVQIGAMRTFASEDNAELQLARSELDSMRRELSRIEGESGPTRRQTSGNGKEGMESARLLRDLKYHEVVFAMLAKQYELAKIDEARDASIIQVLDHAVVPDHKSKPKRLYIVLLSIVAAFIVAVLAAFFREAIAKARNDPRQAAQLQSLRRYLGWR